MTTAIFLTLALLAQAPPAVPATAPATEARPIAPEFVATIQKCEQAMDALKQFSVTARLTSSLESPGMKQGSTSTQTISAKRPGKMLITADWAQFGESAERPQLRVLLDGTEVFKRAYQTLKPPEMERFVLSLPKRGKIELVLEDSKQ